MQLKSQVEWALHCCAVLSGLPAGRYLPTKALAEFHGTPKEYLSKGLQALSQAGLVEGTLGPSGGYRLAKAPEEISFLDIVEAVEGREPTFKCTEIRQNIPCPDEPKTCTRRDEGRPCAIAREMWDADRAWRDHLGNHTLADLLKTLRRDLPAEQRQFAQAWILERS